MRSDKPAAQHTGKALRPADAGELTMTAQYRMKMLNRAKTLAHSLVGPAHQYGAIARKYRRVRRDRLWRC